MDMTLPPGSSMRQGRSLNARWSSRGKPQLILPSTCISMGQALMPMTSSKRAEDKMSSPLSA